MVLRSLLPVARLRRSLGQRLASSHAASIIPAGGSSEVVVQQHELTAKDVTRLQRLRNVGISAHIELVTFFQWVHSRIRS